MIFLAIVQINEVKSVRTADLGKEKKKIYRKAILWSCCSAQTSEDRHNAGLRLTNIDKRNTLSNLDAPPLQAMVPFLMDLRPILLVTGRVGI